MVVSSLNLGILSAIMGFIIQMFMELLFFLINLLYAVFAYIFFLLGSVFAYFADFFQAVFKALAGLGSIGFDKPSNSYIGMDSDPILALISHRIVINMFISLFVVGIGLMIVSVIVQMIRQEYTTEGAKNSKGEILGKAVKAFSNMIIIPVVCVIGILLSNTILRLLDKATSNSSQSIGATVFISAAYNANYMRSSAHGPGWIIDMTGTFYESIDIGALLYGDKFVGGQFTEDDKQVGSEWMDSMYSNGGTIGNATITCIDLADEIDYAFRNFSDIEDNRLSDLMVGGGDYFDYKQAELVGKYYNMGKINYVIFIAGEVMCAWMMLNVTIGMIMRMYKAALYFMILPPILAISPIKDAYGSWKQKFIGNILGAYGPVVGINLFFTVLPVVQQIEVFQPEGLSFLRAHGYNLIMQAIFAIVGLLMVKKFVTEVAGLIGADDSLSAGEGMTKAVAGGVAKVGMAAMGAGALAMKAGKKIGGMVKDAKDSDEAQANQNNYRNVNQASDLLDKKKLADEAQNEMDNINKEYKAKHMTKKQRDEQLAAARKKRDENTLSDEENAKLDSFRKQGIVKGDSLSEESQQTKKHIDERIAQGRFVKNKDGSVIGAWDKRNEDRAKEIEDMGGKPKTRALRWAMGKAGGFVKNKAKSTLGMVENSLNEGLSASTGNLFKAMGIDVDKSKAKAAKGKGGLLSNAVAGIAGGIANLGERNRSREYGARYSEAQGAVANRADTLVERLLQDILKTLKDKNASEKEKNNARQLGKTLSGGNEELAKKFDMDVSKLSVDDFKAKFNATEKATLKANAVDMSASQMARGKGVQDSNLLKAVEGATFKAELGSGVVNEFAQKVKAASMEAAEKIAAKSKSDSDKQVAAIKDLKDALVSAMKENNKNNSKK